MLNQKIVLSAFLAAAALPVCAQSSLQIYGRVNTTVEQQKLGGETVRGVFNNSSRIGFKGTEDLGQGLKAGFILESGFASDNGAGAATGGGLDFGRQSELFVQNDAGMLRLGNFTSESYFATADMVSMHNHDTGASSDALYAWFYRDTNKVAYRTPVVANTWVEVGYSFHEKQDTQKNVWDVAANYENGNLGLGLGLTDHGNDRQVAVRASYSIDQWTLGGYVQRVESGKHTSAEEKWANYRLAAAYSLGNSELHANVGYADRKGGRAATQWTLGANHNLSKRTKVYASYSRVNNSDNASYGYGANSTLETAAGGVTGKNFSALAIGVRHNF